MIFGNFKAIYLLVLIIPLLIFYVIGLRRNKKIIENFAQKELLKELVSEVDKRKRAIKMILYSGVIIFCILSLMRPQGVFHTEEFKRSRIAIIVAIDTSKSMLTEDVKPNRLELSKTLIKDFVGKLNDDRIGLVAFAGNAFLVCPLTVDYNAFLLSLDSLDVTAMPRGGTSISNAILEAVKGFKMSQENSKIIILISDGEEHEGDVIKVANEAQKGGIKILSIGVGTAEGDIIPMTDENGQRGFLKDRQGNIVKSRLTEDILEKIALNTGGEYLRVTEAVSVLDNIYNEKLSNIEKREIKSRMKKHYKEQFQIPLVIALLLLMTEFLISERKKKK